MRELIKAIPDVDVLLELEPEELAATLLVLLIQRRKSEPGFLPNLHNLSTELSPSQFDPGLQYPDQKREEVRIAYSEAWNWLEVQGLLVAAEGHNGTSGFRTFSRKASCMASKEEVRRFAISRSLPKETLHPMLRASAWSAFIRSEYDTSVFEAMKAVEVSIRHACPEIDKKSFGVDLARKAFSYDQKNPGSLTDTALPLGEQESIMHFVSGALGTFKNPHSHRYVNIDNPQRAKDTLGLASLLLTMIDSAHKP